jgi:signal transduction histidine kinase
LFLSLSGVTDGFIAVDYFTILTAITIITVLMTLIFKSIRSGIKAKYMLEIDNIRHTEAIMFIPDGVLVIHDSGKILLENYAIFDMLDVSNSADLKRALNDIQVENVPLIEYLKVHKKV